MMYKWVLAVCLCVGLSGCFLTKIVTVPMRLAGAVVSIVPIVGNTVDANIDNIADIVDEFPL